MANDIAIKKTTLLLVAGLAIVFLAGGYFLYAMGSGEAASHGTAGTGAENADAGAGAPATPNGSGAVQTDEGGNDDATVQDIHIRALSSYGYDKNEVTVRKGVPVRLHFSAESGAGCGRAFYIYGLGVQAVSRNGEEQVVDFTPAQAGTYEYNCGMKMFRPGRLVVV